MKLGMAQQLELRPRLPVIVGNVDYLENEARLLRIDDLLRRSGLEDEYVSNCVVQWKKERRDAAYSGQVGRPFRLMSDTQSGQVGHPRSEATLVV
jgi:hypothetical protein